MNTRLSQTWKCLIPVNLPSLKKTLLTNIYSEIIGWITITFVVARKLFKKAWLFCNFCSHDFSYFSRKVQLKCIIVFTSYNVMAGLNVITSYTDASINLVALIANQHCMHRFCVVEHVYIRIGTISIERKSVTSRLFITNWDARVAHVSVRRNSIKVLPIRSGKFCTHTRTRQRLRVDRANIRCILVYWFKC